MPEPAKSLGPSDQLIHAAVQISKGTTALIVGADQIKVSQRHEEHQIDGASCVSKQRSPQQIDKKGPNNLVDLQTGGGGLYLRPCVEAPDRIDLNGVGPLHVWDYTKKALIICHSIRGHPV